MTAGLVGDSWGQTSFASWRDCYWRAQSGEMAKSNTDCAFSCWQCSVCACEMYIHDLMALFHCTLFSPPLSEYKRQMVFGFPSSSIVFLPLVVALCKIQTKWNHVRILYKCTRSSTLAGNSCYDLQEMFLNFFTSHLYKKKYNP